MAALTLAEAAEWTGLDEATVRGLARIGVTAASEDGPFEVPDLQRVLTAAAYLDAGFTLEQLASSIANRVLSFEIADAFYQDPIEPSGRTFAEFATSIGEPMDRLRAIYGAFGLPLPEAWTRTRKVEEELVEAFVTIWRVADGEDATIRAARIVGDSARRVSEGWVDLFVEQVSMPGMSRHDTYEDYVAATVTPAAQLVELAPKLLVWLQQRHSVHAMQSVNVELFEHDLVARQVIPERPHQPPVIAFADLVGYTRMTDVEGDERAVDAAGHLQELAEGAARVHGGRVVKLLGDGAMFRFDEAATAAIAMLDLAVGIPASGLGPAHLGLELGSVIERDGDYFGRTVNLAARIASSAGAGEVLAGPGAAVLLASDGRFDLVPAGERTLKGFADAVSVWRVQSAAGAGS
jgi:adenylate cyclase